MPNTIEQTIVIGLQTVRRKVGLMELWLDEWSRLRAEDRKSIFSLFFCLFFLNQLATSNSVLQCHLFVCATSAKIKGNYSW